MKLIYFILTCLPSFLNIGIRRLMGNTIGKNVKIGLGTLIISNDVKIGDNVKIGPLTYIKTDKLTIDNNSTIKPLSIISTRKVKIGKYVHIAPLSIIKSEFTINSKITIGDHSRIFPYCWLDTGEGITIGKDVGIGGHSLIFTHGAWTDYIKGGPVSLGPVVIKDNVWLPWRVFILPNVVIGENSIIGANSLINKSIGSNMLAGGIPAKILKENLFKDIDPSVKTKRAINILNKFAVYIKNKYNIDSNIKNQSLNFTNFKISVDNPDNLKKGDLLILINKQLDNSNLQEFISNGVSILEHHTKSIKIVTKNKIYESLIIFLRRYGIRLYKL